MARNLAWCASSCGHASSIFRMARTKRSELPVWWPRKIDPPAGSPVEWRLLTNRTAETLAEVAELIDWYRARWEIEILFHILKNGCRIESLQLRTIDGLQRAIALYLIVSWRIAFLMSLLQNSPAPVTAPHHSLTGSDFRCERRLLGGAANLMAWLAFFGRTPLQHSSNAPQPERERRGHCRNRINWSADSARMPNIRWAITLVSPLTLMVLPPNSSFSRALLRSAAVRSL